MIKGVGMNLQYSQREIKCQKVFEIQQWLRSAKLATIFFPWNEGSKGFRVDRFHHFGAAVKVEPKQIGFLLFFRDRRLLADPLVAPNGTRGVVHFRPPVGGCTERSAKSHALRTGDGGPKRATPRCCQTRQCCQIFGGAYFEFILQKKK